MSELPVEQLLSVAEAIRILDSEPVTPRETVVALDDADGWVLARDIASDRDYPPFDKALVDGFAVRASDALSANATLRVAGEIAAGRVSDVPLMAGECVAIMTGAPLPIGADAAVPIERTRRDVDRVTLLDAVKPDQFVSRRGADCAAGAIVLERGTRLRPAQLAVLAQVGAERVPCFAKPRAAILVTGDEIVDVDASPGPAQIRDCNSILLASLLRRLGCDVVHHARVRDDPAATRGAIEQCLSSADLTFISGGMSMGVYDYVPATLKALGLELKITKLRIKPGKPFVFASGECQSTPHHSSVFGLPGNPVSAFCCTVRLASRLIDRAAGLPSPRERWITAPLADDLPANGPREFYQPAFLDDAGTLHPLAWKGSADIFTLARANALLVRPENETARRRGEPGRALVI